MTEATYIIPLDFAWCEMIPEKFYQCLWQLDPHTWPSKLRDHQANLARQTLFILARKLTEENTQDIYDCIKLTIGMVC